MKDLFARSAVLRTLQTYVLLPLVMIVSVWAQADYNDDWGPQLSAPVPMLEAFDQDGQLQNLDSLSGDQGLLLFLNRSADW